MARRQASGFNRPRKLTQDVIRGLPENPGVYEIRLSVKGKWQRGIPRFKGVDKRRVLAYGCSKNLRNRLQAFRRSTDHSAGHHEGNLLRILNEKAELGLESVLISWYETADYKQEEERLIKEYVSRYGEVPPLNSAIPGRENGQNWRG